MAQEDAIRELETMARKYRDLVLSLPASENRTTLAISNDPVLCYSVVLGGLVEFKDKSTLPFFEEMSLSTNEGIRRSGIRGYIMVTGAVDALPFIEGLAKDSRYTENDRYWAYTALTYLTRIPSQINQPAFPYVPSPPPPPKLSSDDRETLHAFMLKKTQTDNNENIVKELDQLLAKQLSGYAASLQRMQTVEKLAETCKEHWRNYWEAAKEEIEKTPVNERKDFRAKGGLLDPARKGD